VRDRIEHVVLDGRGQRVDGGRVELPAARTDVRAGATRHLYQQLDDPDKLRAIVLEMATGLIH
jgi:hypothetical protein